MTEVLDAPPDARDAADDPDGRRRSRISRSALAVVLLVAVSVGGVFVGTRLERKTPAPDARLAPRADGSLAVDPPPLTLADVAAAPAGSASQAVLRLWFWGQWGSAPNIVSGYAPALVRHLGADRVAGAYYSRRQAMLGMRPKIVDELTTRVGTTVTVEGLVRNAQPERYAFTLRRTGQRWQIIYDNLLEDGLAAYVQTSSVPNPNGRTVPAFAARAGLRAAREMRRFALGLEFGRAPSR